MPAFLETIRSALEHALAVAVPVECAGCGASDTALCGDCRTSLDPVVTPRIVHGLVVRTALTYEGRVRRIVLAFKEEGRTGLAKALAAPLAATIDAALAAAPPGCEIAVVPSSRAAHRRRGYHPIGMLVARAGYRDARVLSSTGTSAAQKRLGVAERERNVAGALRADRPLDGRVFVVVDDILTTGATVREASRAIANAGGRVVGGASLAFTRKLAEGS